MRILIAGEDEVAYRLAEALMADHAVFLVCPEAQAGPRIDRLDVEPVYGLVTTPEILRRARIDGADLFVACSPSDEQNLVACVLAKRLGAKRTICFLFRPDFRASLEYGKLLIDSLGIDSIVRPPEQLAREILRIITVPGALDVEVFIGGKVLLLRHAVEENAAIAAAPLKDLGLPPDIVLVMARRGNEIYIPKGNSQLKTGDKITAMGNPDGMNRLLFRFLRVENRWREGRRATIIGGGDVGLAVALGLEDQGWSVKVIEHNRARCEKVSSVLNSLVLHGDGADLDLLEQERIADDSVLVAVTSNDEKNLLISLLAKHLGVPRIITRADNQANEKLFEKVGVDVVRSAQGAAIQSVVRGLVESRTELLAELEHGDAAVLEFDLPGDFAPVHLERLAMPESAIIGAILRDRQVIIPKGKEEIQGGDKVLVFCLRQHEEKVRTFFHRPVSRESIQD